MIIALDRKAQDCVDYGCLQLRTPLTKYAREHGVYWVMDNGSFSGFDEMGFIRMATQGMNDRFCKWIAIPDSVGDHEETLDLFEKWTVQLSNYWIPFRERFKKWAFVIQDGATIETIPWDEITAVFLGGTTRFKLSRGAYLILEEAKKRDKWVHVGRVNTSGRIGYFHGVADSIDGSGIAKYDHMLQRARNTIRHLESSKNLKLDDF